MVHPRVFESVWFAEKSQKATFDQVLLRVMTFCTFQIDLQMNVT